MPRYFFNIREASGKVIKDATGRVLPGLAAANAEALKAVRQLPGLKYGGRFEITDEAGNIVLSVPFVDEPG